MDESDDSDDIYCPGGPAWSGRYVVNVEIAGSNPARGATWSGGEVGYHACLSRKRPRVQVPSAPQRT